MNKDIERVMFSEEELDKRVCELARQIDKDYQNKELYIVGVLKGSFIFAGDLARKLSMSVVIDFCRASSYGAGTVSSGEVFVKDFLGISPAGKDVLVVEDILDSGNTLKSIKHLIEQAGAKSVKLCALLDKPERRQADIRADYVGFTVPDEFLVGYGLDYNEKYRNLPYIGILSRKIYENING